jgi:hypothetical protein
MDAAQAELLGAVIHPSPAILTFAHLYLATFYRVSLRAIAFSVSTLWAWSSRAWAPQ